MQKHHRESLTVWGEWRSDADPHIGTQLVRSTAGAWPQMCGNLAEDVAMPALTRRHEDREEFEPSQERGELVGGVGGIGTVEVTHQHARPGQDVEADTVTDGVGHRQLARRDAVCVEHRHMRGVRRGDGGNKRHPHVCTRHGKHEGLTLL